MSPWQEEIPDENFEVLPKFLGIISVSISEKKKSLVEFVMEFL